MTIVNMVNTMSNELLYIAILDLFDFYSKVIKYNDSDKSLRIAELIHDKIKSLSSLNYDFYNTAMSLADITNNKDKLTIKNSIAGKPGVKLMNIHQSKGLEFPVCYFVCLNLNLNESDKKKRIDFDINSGIRVSAYKEGIIKTPLFYLFENQWEKKEYSEHLRKFYVALTRAREKMVFIKCNEIKNEEKSDEKQEKMKENSFANYFKILENKNKDYIESLKSNDEYDIDGFLASYYKRDKNNDEDIINSLNNNQPVDYSKENLNIISNPINKKRFSKELHKINNYDVINNVRDGIYYHEIMENIDFKDPIKSLNKLGLDNLTASNIKRILGLDIINDLYRANKIYTEYEFIFNDTLGIIDLLAEYDDKFVIIDYKLFNIDDPEYANQINGYKSYIKSKTNKDIKCYLLSLMELKYKEIK